MAANIQLSFRPASFGVNRPATGVNPQINKGFIKLKNVGDATFTSGTLSTLYDGSGTTPTGLTISLSTTAITDVEANEEIVIDVSVTVASTLPDIQTESIHLIKFQLDGVDIEAVSGTKTIELGLTAYRAEGSIDHVQTRRRSQKGRLIDENPTLGQFVENLGVYIWKDMEGNLNFAALGGGTGGSGGSGTLIVPERTVFVSNYFINHDPAQPPFFNSIIAAITHITANRAGGVDGTEGWTVVVYEGTYTHSGGSPLRVYGYINVKCIGNVNIAGPCYQYPFSRISGEETSVADWNAAGPLGSPPAWYDVSDTTIDVRYIGDFEIDIDNFAATIICKRIGNNSTNTYLCAGDNTFIEIEAKAILGEIIIARDSGTLAYPLGANSLGGVRLTNSRCYSTTTQNITFLTKKVLKLDSVELICQNTNGISIEVGVLGLVDTDSDTTPDTEVPAFVVATHSICNKPWRMSQKVDGSYDPTDGIQVYGNLHVIIWNDPGHIDGIHTMPNGSINVIAAP